MKYRKEIDGLRALAVIPVILFHAGVEQFSGGFVGVDVFFVLSGYLITSILINDLDSGHFSIKKFYERRARRILPALFFIMACTIPFAWVWMLPSQFKDFSQSLVAVSLFVSNFLFWRKTDYFAPSAEDNPLLHTWSLAVEEQFYIFFPILLFLFWKMGRRPAFYVVLALSAVSLGISEWGWRNLPAANFYLIPSRMWELGAGSLCAFLTYGRPQRENAALSGLGLALIVFAIFVYDETTPFPSVFALAPVGGTALVIIFAGPSTLAARLLSLPLVVGIGLISYSAYLWHQPLFAFARIRFEAHPPAAIFLLLTALTFGLAYLSWRFVEQPFRRRPAPALPSQNAVFVAAGTVASAFIIFGLYGYVAQGVPQRMAASEIQQRYLQTAFPSDMRAECHSSRQNNISPENACQYNLPNGDIAVLGDSHTVELAKAIADEVESMEDGVRHFSVSGCAPAYKSPAINDFCTQWTDAAVDYIANNDDIKYVVVSYRIHAALAGDHADVYPGVPEVEIDSRSSRILASFHRMLSDLIMADKTVILVDQFPELPNNMENIIYRTGNQERNLPGVPRSWWNERKRFFEENFSVPAGVIQIKVDDLFCAQEICFAGRDGTSYYFDDDHPSVAGAAVVAKRISELISGMAAER